MYMRILEIVGYTSLCKWKKSCILDFYILCENCLAYYKNYDYENVMAVIIRESNSENTVTSSTTDSRYFHWTQNTKRI